MSTATCTVKEESEVASCSCTVGGIFGVEVGEVFVPVTLDGGVCKIESEEEEDTVKQLTLEDCAAEVVLLYFSDENRERRDCIMLLTLPILVFGLGRETLVILLSEWCGEERCKADSASECVQDLKMGCMLDGRYNGDKGSWRMCVMVITVEGVE
jgi:hypothetical protein